MSFLKKDGSDAFFSNEILISSVGYNRFFQFKCSFKDLNSTFYDEIEENSGLRNINDDEGSTENIESSNCFIDILNVQ